MKKTIMVKNLNVVITETGNKLSWPAVDALVAMKNAMRQARQIEGLLKKQCPSHLKEYIEIKIDDEVEKVGPDDIYICLIVEIDEDVIDNADTELERFVNRFEERYSKAIEKLKEAIKKSHGNPTKIPIRSDDTINGVEGIVVEDETVSKMVLDLLKDQISTPVTQVVELSNGKQLEFSMPARPKPELQSEDVLIEGEILSITKNKGASIKVGGKVYGLSLIPLDEKTLESLESNRMRLGLAYLTGETIELKVRQNIKHFNGVKKVDSYVLSGFVDDFDREAALSTMSRLIDELA